MPLEIAPLGERSVRIRRSFAAPRAGVWRAFTEPALVTKWLWARAHPMIECVQDVRPGGQLRWVWQGPAGWRMGLSGSYLEVVPPVRLVHTELFDEDWTGGEAVVTILLHDVAGGTAMEMTVAYASPAARDAVLRTPMAEGMEEGYARLDTFLPLWAGAA
ncbi:MAG: SRPBCC family protein [Rhodobacteraceae bacterium]|jgi:uncharacterized protein YndB with AHSA1/START domain|nr:SRPBCC family protein [Paracoccaceae bacterium]